MSGIPPQQPGIRDMLRNPRSVLALFNASEANGLGAPEAVSAVALERVHSRRMFAIVLILAALTAVSAAGWWRAETRFMREARLTYVKLAPNGTWTLDHDLGDQASYYDATLRTVLYDWLERRYSMRSSVLDDWGIANAMYSPELQKWFVQTFKATQVATEHAQCMNCSQTTVKVRAHQHVDVLPPAITDTPSAPIRTLLYATESVVPPGAVSASSETRKLYRVTWRFLCRQTIQSRAEVLRYNPLGIEILDVEVTDDPA